MESAVSDFSTTIITFIVLITATYMVITFSVHLGLKTIITNRELRNGIIQLTSIIAFGVIAMTMF